MECIVTIIGTVFIYFEKYHHMVGFNRISRVRIRVSVRIKVRFSFIGANLYIAVCPLNCTHPNSCVILCDQVPYFLK